MSIPSKLISDVLRFSFKLNGMETRDVLWMLGSAFNVLPLFPVQLCLASKTTSRWPHKVCCHVTIGPPQKSPPGQIISEKNGPGGPIFSE